MSGDFSCQKFKKPCIVNAFVFKWGQKGVTYNKNERGVKSYNSESLTLRYLIRLVIGSAFVLVITFFVTGSQNVAHAKTFYRDVYGRRWRDNIFGNDLFNRAYPSSPSSIKSESKLFISNSFPSRMSSKDSRWRKGGVHNVEVGQYVSFYHRTYNYTGLEDQHLQSDFSIFRIPYQQGDVTDNRLLQYNGDGTILHENYRNTLRRGDVFRYGHLTDNLRNAETGRSVIKITPVYYGNRICEVIHYQIQGHIDNHGNIAHIFDPSQPDVHSWDGLRRIERERSITPNSTTVWEGSPDHDACFYVPYIYELTPCVLSEVKRCEEADRNIVRTAGSSVRLMPKVSSTTSYPTKNTKWKITHWEVAGANEFTRTPNTGGENNSDDTCSFYNSSSQFKGKVVSCRTWKEGTNRMDGGRTVDDFRFNVSETAEMGRRYCWAVSVSPYKMTKDQTKEQQDNNTGWRHSKPTCILVARYPKFQVWSGGVYSSGGIKSKSLATSRGVVGSWAEFDVLSLKAISGFGSVSQTSNSNLTFQNKEFGKLGFWGNWRNNTSTVAWQAKEISKNYLKSDPERQLEVIGDLSQNWSYNGYDDSGLNRKGVTRIIYANNLKLTGDLINKDPDGSDIGQFQQTIIVAKNVLIDNAVQRIDAWIIATDKVLTCSAGISEHDFTGDVTRYRTHAVNRLCGNRLKINGAISAGRLESWRTYGSTPEKPEEPAEIYNQRGDLYLWGYREMTQNSKLITTYMKELPARY